MERVRDKAMPRRPALPGALAPLACSLLVLLSGCSWLQALHDTFRDPGQPAQAQAATPPALQARVRMLYPRDTRTVEQAVNYMLEPHAYRAAPRNETGDRIAGRTFINNFDNDPVPLRVALERLMGRNGQVILDPERKLYAFRLRKPDEAGIAFAGITTARVAAADGGTPDNVAPQEAQPGTLVPGPARDPAPAGKTALAGAAPVHAGTQDEQLPAQNPASCASIHLRNRAMLSVAVREYFLACGFDRVSWKLGAPGRYADYRLLQDHTVPLPARHLDLVEFLQSRFGIKTLIHDNKRVEFYDENHSL